MPQDELPHRAAEGVHCGEMTPVLQLTDIGVAFEFKRYLEAAKAELRREKRGPLGGELEFLMPAEGETKCSSADLMKILGRANRKMLRHDEQEDPERLLRQARSAGWLSYQADPVRKVLVRCDAQPWMQGRAEEFPEKTHRHPSAWWGERYNWLNEEGEPCEADWKRCGRNVFGMEYMREEFPEQAPNEKLRLNCLQGRKNVEMPCLAIEDEDMTFGEVAKNLVPEEFLRTQREKFEEARMRAIRNWQSRTTRGHGSKKQQLSKTVLRGKMKLRQKNKRKNKR